MTVEQLNEVRSACEKFGINFELSEVGIEDGLFSKRIKINGGFVFPKELTESINQAVGEDGRVFFVGSIIIDKKPLPR